MLRPLNGPPWGSPQDLQSIPTLRRQVRGSSGIVPNQPSAVIFDPHHYAGMIELSVEVPSTSAGGVKVLDRNDTFRNFLILRNTDTTNTIYIGFGSQASAVSPLALAPGSPFGIIALFDVVVPQDDVYAFSTAGTPVLAVGYSTLAYQP